MPQSLDRVVLHIVFSTKRRYPFLTDPEIRNEMHAYLGGTCNELDCQSITVGGVADHVHILCFLSRTVTIAQLVGDLKRSSSKWIKGKGGMLRKFAWQNGYGAFSVRHSELDWVRAYIASQAAHHSKTNFQDEYRAFLEENEIEFDEQYVWY